MKVRVGSDAGLSSRAETCTCRYLPVDPVAVVVHGDEIVVRADLLQLAECLQQRVAIPEPHVVDRRRVGTDVCQGQVRFAVEVARLHAVEPPRAARGGDVVLEIRRLAGQLVGRHDEFLYDQRAARPRSRDPPRDVSANRERGLEQRNFSPEDADDHRRGRQQRVTADTRIPGKEDVHVRIARADERPRGRVQEVGCVHEPELGAISRKSNARSVPEVPERPVHSRPRGEVAAPVPAQPMQDRRPR